ncbi:MAG: hypothetical protein L6R35_006087 [Caloplaca aegaea]|nr:MAG: hypothetical protein L6R35_006087 [Caloplaca aegaea]
MAEEQDSRYHLRPAQNLHNHIVSSQYPNSSRRISFLHPAYRRFNNVLFRMFAVDSPEGGLHHATARIACAIIAGNRWDGFFSRTPTGLPIDAADDDLLTDAEYYFIVPSAVSSTPAAIPNVNASPSTAVSSTHDSAPYMYPVVPGFKEWMFPHDDLPTTWKEVEIHGSSGGRLGSDAVALRDISCRMTAYGEGCDNSHLCPLTEMLWYQENRMDQYGDLNRGGRQGINDPSNIMLLRTDLHRAWDKMQFVHTPKRSSTGRLEFVSHVLVYSKELGDLYHNARLHRLGVARECLFARFAWTIFPLLSGFLQQGHDRYLLRANSDTSELVSADECFRCGDSWKPANQRTSRPPSPAKRPRADAGIDEELEDDGGPAAKCARQALNTDLSKLIRTSELTTEGKSYPQREIPGLNTSQSTINGSNHPDSTQFLDEWAKERATIEGLYKSALAAERARSDPDGRWRKHMETEQQWVDEILEHGGGVDAREMSRFMRAWGQDTADDEQRACCIGLLECECNSRM